MLPAISGGFSDYDFAGARDRIQRTRATHIFNHRRYRFRGGGFRYLGVQIKRAGDRAAWAIHNQNYFAHRRIRSKLSHLLTHRHRLVLSERSDELEHRNDTARSSSLRRRFRRNAVGGSVHLVRCTRDPTWPVLMFRYSLSSQQCENVLAPVRPEGSAIDLRRDTATAHRGRAQTHLQPIAALIPATRADDHIKSLTFSGGNRRCR